MKNFNNKKSILERGGLMIEALAMLGLIAVVTPTMYKKSAERTMEVEDINTSTTIRTLMNAAESYVAANYIQLLNDDELKLPEDPAEEQIAVKPLELDELAPYLPYKFETEGSLYNYGTPKVTIVRAGDSISAFALFPAKGNEDEGIGQERTVRIASLIGANGGYVSDDTEAAREAHGVGGVWSLDTEHYGKVFSGDSSNKYSIVTASSNVANSSTAGAEPDMTKYLQRTRENNAGDGEELWRNAMRTDLYLGLVNAADDAWDKHTELFSIQNVNKLIVGGHDEANGYKENTNMLDDNDSINGGKMLKEVSGNKVLNDSYGLYISGSGPQGKKEDGNKTYGNAFISGSLEALKNGSKALFNVYYEGGDKTQAAHLTFDGTRFEIGKTKVKRATDKDTYAIQADVKENTKTMKIFEDTIAIEDSSATAGARKIDILGASGDKTIHIHEAKDAGTYGNKKALVAVDTSSDALPSDVEKLTADKYNTMPDFGVDVDGNMVVQGLLTAGQLDANKVRSNELAVGSEKIDDNKKWLNVDKDGVRIHDPASDYESNKKAKREFIADDKAVAIRAGATAQAISDNSKVVGMDSELILADAGLTAKVGDNKDLNVASGKVGFNIKNDEITVGNTKSNTDAAHDTSKDTEYLVNFDKGANVDIQKGNLKVSDGSNPVLTVLGNKDHVSKSKITDAPKSQPKSGGTAEDYVIATHGNTVMTNPDDTLRYLALGPEDKSTAINVVAGNGGKTNDASTQLIYVDLDDRNNQSYTVAPGQTETDYKTAGKSGHQERSLRGGSIYIRKGLIDIAPDKGLVGTAANTKDYNADNGRGIVRASRFVANNVTIDGDRVEPHDFFTTAGTFAEYNGSKNRYDTFMVNPAYTSVMNDIKLTSRMGARLSDVLPNFITKAIYTATNSWSESAVKNKNAETLTLTCDSKNICKLSDSDVVRDSSGSIYNGVMDPGYTQPASPLIGTVPAPQCPPGYARVIMVTPASIYMAQAGQLMNNPNASNNLDVSDFANMVTGGNAYDANKPAADQNLSQKEKAKAAFAKLGIDDKPTYRKDFRMEAGCKKFGADGRCTEYFDDGFFEFDVKKIRQNYKGESVTLDRGSVDPNEANKADITVQSETFTDHWMEGKVDHYDPKIINSAGTLDLNDKRLFGEVKNMRLTDEKENTQYVLSSRGNALDPVVFQKSNWLKTQAVELKASSGYVRGWAILMGFIYNKESYDGISGVSPSNFSTLNGGTGSFYWNIFPVDIDSLEAYITTYCYYDSDDKLGYTAGTSGDYLPMIDALSYYPNGPIPENENVTYRNKLNDPSMKYDELW